MRYGVLLQRLAVDDLEEATAWAAKNAPAAAARWLDRFHAALRTLDTNPQRCPLAKEDPFVERELREFHFGRRPNVFRVVFTIDDDVVRILRVRRAQRRRLARRQIDEAIEP